MDQTRPDPGSLVISTAWAKKSLESERWAASPAPPGVQVPRTHPLVDVLLAGLILLLHALLQEVDAQLEAEVLLLQVIEVLGKSAISIRHGGQPMGRSLPNRPLTPET